MSLDEFRERARRAMGASAPAGTTTAATTSARLVPVWRDLLLDTETPVAAFAKLRQEPFAFLLESAPAGGETWARYTFMGTSPRAAWKLEEGVVRDWTPELGWHNDRRPADPLSDLETLLRDAEPVDAPEIGEFWTGAVGYFGYDVARIIERLPTPPARGVDVPDALFVFTNALVIFDNLRSQARVVAPARVAANASDAELQSAYDGSDAHHRRDHPTTARTVRTRSARPRSGGACRPKVCRGTTGKNSSLTSSAFASTSSPATRFRCRWRVASTCRSTSRRRTSIARSA